jgi:hypothetical protein
MVTESRYRTVQSLCLAVCLLVCIYIGVYALLSLNGRYEPAVVGLDHVKWYGWAPQGFVQESQWNRSLMWIFLPLYYLDTHFWHKGEHSDSGKYPINEVG